MWTSIIGTMSPSLTASLLIHISYRPNVSYLAFDVQNKDVSRLSAHSVTCMFLPHNATDVLMLSG